MALFSIPNIAILSQFQKILRLSRDFSKYRGFIAVIGKITRYRDDHNKVTSLVSREKILSFLKIYMIYVLEYTHGTRI